ncbi:hypothetical protein PR048_019078 [Dryococelus australis]|uniref:Uncharacterized protein n=1 Tax=Dryococelus australis TaxID=614101 RepID=A0ABQ9H2K1_9NEOP|nr:hypothetical protein PR048_019078 [Dryococelus australis]
MNNGCDSYITLATAMSRKSSAQSLPDLLYTKTSYEYDHHLIEAHGDENTYFNKVEHSKRLEKLDDSYYKVMCVAKSLKQTSVSSGQQTATQSHARVTLPVIKFPHFLEKSKDLSNVELFTYLKFFLSGETLSLIHTLPMTSDNSDIAWNLLIKRYDNKWVIMANHRRTLPAPALNLPVDQWDMLLLHLLEKRMDQALRKQCELVVHELDIPTIE